MTYEQGPESQDTPQSRDYLLSQLGAVAARPVMTSEQHEITEELSVSRRDNPGFADIHQTIESLAGKRLLILDIVLAVDATVAEYVASKDGLLPPPHLHKLYTRQIPDLLRATLPSTSTKARKQLTSVWGAYIEGRPDIPVGASAKPAKFTKGSPKQPPAGSTVPSHKRSNKSKAKRQRVAAQKSSSLQASRNFYNLQNESTDN